MLQTYTCARVSVVKRLLKAVKVVLRSGKTPEEQ
jgi:hypothetical protein